jgi:hypothetical protein
MFIVISVLMFGLTFQTTPVDPWTNMKFFVGTWSGTSTGQPGNGSVSRTYEFVLGNKFLHVTNKSTYPPQDKNPKGEIHEDWGMFSHDSGRKKLVLRQFHLEGFVNQ